MVRYMLNDRFINIRMETMGRKCLSGIDRHKVELPGPRFNPMTMKYQRCFTFSDPAWANLYRRAQKENMSVADYVNKELLNQRPLFQPVPVEHVSDFMAYLEMPRLKAMKVVDPSVRV